MIRYFRATIWNAIPIKSKTTTFLNSFKDTQKAFDNFKIKQKKMYGSNILWYVKVCFLICESIYKCETVFDTLYIEVTHKS